MLNNPIESIKNAELEAENIVLEANAKKINIIRSAQEDASKEADKILKAAEEQASAILKKTQAEDQENQRSSRSSLKQEMGDLKLHGEQRQKQAIEEILKQLHILQ